VNIIRIPHPIPAADRARLIAAGKEACSQPDQSMAKKEAQANVHKIIADIESKYGVTEEYHEQ
jgi:hypothetical protein